MEKSYLRDSSKNQIKNKNKKVLGLRVGYIYKLSRECRNT